MATPLPPAPVKFFVGVLAADRAAVQTASARLEAAWGPADCRSGVQPWAHTDYYAPETGPAILRCFLGFAALADPGTLAARKRETNQLEMDLAHELASAWPRPVNLDPGYVAPDKVVLASCKNYAHRIYLANGVYAEVTLLFRKGDWETLPWTYPDYASGAYEGFFRELRDRLMQERAQPDTQPAAQEDAAP